MYFTLIKYLDFSFTMLVFRLKLLFSKDYTQAIEEPESLWAFMSGFLVFFSLLFFITKKMIPFSP